MPKLMIKELSGQWTFTTNVRDMAHAEQWARNQFKDYDDTVLKRTITGVVVQDNMIYLYYDIRVTKDGNTFPVKVVMKVVEQ